MQIYRFESLPSTQLMARELAEEGAEHGTAVVADAQTAGRGTHGRTWSSPAGLNLYVTMILRPAIPPAQTPLLTLGVASWLAERLRLQVKWPNDLVTGNGRKVAGILGELELREGQVRYVLVGVGLNVNQREFPVELPNASSLALEFGPQNREEVLGILLDALRTGSQDPQRLPRWRRYAHTLGRRVRVGDIEGVAEALAEDGALVVDGKRLYSGEVLPGALTSS